MRYWSVLCGIVLALLAVLLLIVFAVTPDAPAQAHSDSVGVVLPHSVAASESVLSAGVILITYHTTITSGIPMVMDGTSTILEFAPGVTGSVTATLVPMTPQNPPAGGAIPRSWWITTTAPSYEVTVTFIYSDIGRDVVLVLDQSGSMEFHTLCYGCWGPVSGVDYPGGNIYSLP